MVRFLLHGPQWRGVLTATRTGESRMEHHQLRALSFRNSDRCDLGLSFVSLGHWRLYRLFGYDREFFRGISRQRHCCQDQTGCKCCWAEKFWVSNTLKHPNYLLSFGALRFVSGIKSDFLSVGVWKGQPKYTPKN